MQHTAPWEGLRAGHSLLPEAVNLGSVAAAAVLLPVQLALLLSAQPGAGQTDRHLQEVLLRWGSSGPQWLFRCCMVVCYCWVDTCWYTSHHLVQILRKGEDSSSYCVWGDCFPVLCLTPCNSRQTINDVTRQETRSMCDMSRENGECRTAATVAEMEMRGECTCCGLMDVMMLMCL